MTSIATVFVLVLTFRLLLNFSFAILVFLLLKSGKVINFFFSVSHSKFLVNYLTNFSTLKIGNTTVTVGFFNTFSCPSRHILTFDYGLLRLPF